MLKSHEAFISYYQEIKANKKEDEVILFMDGVHPDHQTQNVPGVG
jgi:hypothetical protein